jgi:hypothetical protein
MRPNIPGALHEVTQALARDRINIWTHHLANLGRTGFVQLICHPHEAALNVLKEKYKYYASEGDVLAIRMDNTPGALVHVLGILRDNNINVINSYDTFDSDGKAVTVLELEQGTQLTNADRILREKQIHLLDSIGAPHGS